ncbi:MAG: M20/M25/M40 family metallo-hydrolase [Chloroflexi bacterium]|nr:M20/M25/M40 family metallo-hydrolase [Chloroflexota bacterium]
MRFRLPAIPTIRRQKAVIVAAAVFAFSAACTSATATPEPIPTATPEPAPTFTAAPTPTSALQPVELASPAVDAFAVLEEILEELGPRESATDQELAAARYLQSRLQALGYATELQTFTVEGLSLAGLGLTLDTPESREFTALPLIRTGLGDVAGVLTPVGLARPEDIPDAGLEGRIALAERGIITFQSKAENVFAAGAVGLVVYNNVSGIFQGVLATQPEFPVIALSQDDGAAIEALLAGSEIEASIALTLEDLPSRNVIAEKAGPGDAVVVLGGHYDSVPGILAANDNASGIAVLLAIAESLAEVDLPFTLRIVPFGSEELGLLGSRHYVQSLSDEELANTKAMLNFDALGSGTGVSIFGNRDFTELATALGGETGVDVAVTRGLSGGSSDFASFRDAGVPFLMFFSDDFSRIHTERDTIEFVRPELLAGAAAIATALLQSEGFAALITAE